MDQQELEQNECRICLCEYAEQNWNEVLHEQSNLTYKDCYRKFTGLECFDEENFSTMLCLNCSNCLRNMNIFIFKAIENHYLLVEKHSSNLMQRDVEDITKQNADFELVLVEEVDIKPDMLVIEEKNLVEESESLCSSESIPPPLAASVSVNKKPMETNKKEINHSLNQLAGNQMTSKKASKARTPTCCSICSKVLVSKYAAIKHEKTHHENRERSVACPECGLKFYCKLSLRKHAEVHSENRKTYKCEFCDKSFFHRGGLNIHRRIHLGQMISCTLCSKQYYRLIDLDKHMHSHSASRINGNIIPRKKIFVRCEFCGENIRSINYKSHTAKHMNDPLCKCSICGKKFFSRDGCIAHLKNLHKKGNGERRSFIIDLKPNRRCTSLFMQQNTSKIIIKE